MVWWTARLSGQKYRKAGKCCLICLKLDIREVLEIADYEFELDWSKTKWWIQNGGRLVRITTDSR